MKGGFFIVHTSQYVLKPNIIMFILLHKNFLEFHSFTPRFLKSQIIYWFYNQFRTAGKIMGKILEKGEISRGRVIYLPSIIFIFN